MRRVSNVDVIKRTSGLATFFCFFSFGRLLVLKDKEKKPPKVLPSVGFLLGAFVIESTNKVPNLHPFTYL